jgi:SAM-dependent methyltransferase
VLTSKIKGLKFPDEAITRFFFKSGLNNIKSTVLELGCGTGNNLRLFYEYGWDVVGVDLSADAVSGAIENLSSIKTEYQLANNFNIFQDDMTRFLESDFGNSAHTILFPSTLFYLTYEEIVKTLKLLSKLTQPNGFLFFKLLTKEDYRFLNPNKESLGNSSYRLKFSETDEYNQVITFLSRDEWIQLISEHFNFISFNVFDLRFEHVQNSVLTQNSNLIFYGMLS